MSCLIDTTNQNETASNEKEAVLILEDSQAIAALLKGGLQKETGAQIVHCRTLKAAKKALEETQFTFAISGLYLPDGSGDKVLDFLSKHQVPAVIFTAKHNPKAENEYAEMRLLDYIVKDEPNALQRAVTTGLKILKNAQYKVLIVDDMKSARSDLKTFIARQNFNTIEATSGREALDILHNDPTIDLLITDYHMPDMNGYELIKAIRTTRDANDLRIIGISSSSDRRLTSQFLRGGACDFIYRPFVAEELQCRIDTNIETLSQFRSLQFLAQRAPLTSLANRRYFFSRVNKMRAERPSSNTRCEDSIAILDIDHFKQVNDNHGHEAGDNVLKAIAEALCHICSERMDPVGRLGGEEFAIYFKDCTVQDAYELCERLRQAIEAIATMHGGETLKVTASFGLASLQGDDDLSHQLKLADQRLYEAKNRGRNCVCGEEKTTGAEHHLQNQVA